ncbi:MAG: glycosyltransferase [bacterium]|nr:glycosyltransferase [bacterium]
MKILMLSVDGKIFNKKSEVRDRMITYGSLFDELHIVIYTPRGFKEEKIAPNVFLYPTNSRTKFLYFWDAYSVCKKLLKQYSDFVVTSQDAMTNIVALFLKMQFSFPLQIQIHTDFLSPYFKTESLKNFIRYIIYKTSLRYANCIRVVSKRIKDSIIANCKLSACVRSAGRQIANCVTLPIFVDAEKIKNALPVTLPKKYDPVRSCARDRVASPEDRGAATSNGAGFTILWVGRLEREKNITLAITALAQFVKKFPNAGLVIVGDGTERKKLELQATSYKLQANIIFEGWKNDVVGYYKSADVLLVTSWYEGYGMNMVEARIAGIPVIAPDVGVAFEIGAYITDHTADSIAQTLIQLYEQKLPKRDAYEYPYKNKEQYLQLYKESFERCLSNGKKI